MQGDYYLLDKNEQKDTLKRLKVSEASETLGVKAKNFVKNAKKIQISSD